MPTVFDFGRKGTPPTHPELLDWLAVELIEHGWSMKHMHRLIVTSNAYRMSSSAAGAAPTTLARDAENHFYWRMQPVRMEAQVVRDSLLHLAGELDPTLGGPSIPVADEASRRRSLYFVHSHNEHQKFLVDVRRRQRARLLPPRREHRAAAGPGAGEQPAGHWRWAEKIAQRIAAGQPGTRPTRDSFARRF